MWKTFIMLVLTFVLSTPGCTGALNCESLSICKDDGLCVSKGDRCVATDKSCKESEACRQGGYCNELLGICVRPCRNAQVVCTEDYKLTCALNATTWKVVPCNKNDGCVCTPTNR